MSWLRSLSLVTAIAASFYLLYCLNWSHEPSQIHQLNVTLDSKPPVLRNVLHRSIGTPGRVDMYTSPTLQLLSNQDSEYSDLTLASVRRYVVRSAIRTAQEVKDRWQAIIEHRRNKLSIRSILDDPSYYTQGDVIVPDVTDRETVLLLAKMAANAYVPEPHQGDWINITSYYTEENGKQSTEQHWNHGEGFGWNDDGLRGYLFTNDDFSQVVISLKGTSAAVLDNGGSTGPNDKINDNLFFSCCCARISYMWSTVCDCYQGKVHGQSQCSELCLEEALWEQDHYYKAALDIYETAKAMYPDANFWVTGHSLGGAVASMLGRTFGLPTVAFEAPGEKLAARRLHLPRSPGIPVWDDHIWHFGHTADPIFTGDCNGARSSCWIAGYAMETKCHTGLKCMYDPIKDLGWRSSVVNHRIKVVIDEVIKKYNSTAECSPVYECDDCSTWDYVL